MALPVPVSIHVHPRGRCRLGVKLGNIAADYAGGCILLLCAAGLPRYFRLTRKPSVADRRCCCSGCVIVSSAAVTVLPRHWLEVPSR
jgi:hypothetical protein